MSIAKHTHIRKAVLTDSKMLEQCMQAAYAHYQHRMGKETLPPMTVDYKREIKEFPCWIAECEGNVVGGLIMSFEKNYASISNIAVHPDCQGQGLGGALMQFAEKKSQEKGYHEMHLATHVLLIENVSLYQHLGWIEYERDDIRAYMKKSILAP